MPYVKKGDPVYTLSTRELGRQARREANRAAALGETLEPIPHYERPRTRGECVAGIRPCPFVACKYHLAIDVTDTGSIRFTHGDQADVTQMAETCALDVAARGEQTLEQLGQLIGTTRERARQVVDTAVAKLADLLPEDGLRPDTQHERGSQLPRAGAQPTDISSMLTPTRTDRWSA